MLFKNKNKKTFNIITGAVAGSALGYIVGNTAGAIIGGKLAYNYLK